MNKVSIIIIIIIIKINFSSTVAMFFQSYPGILLLLQYRKPGSLKTSTL